MKTIVEKNRAAPNVTQNNKLCFSNTVVIYLILTVRPYYELLFGAINKRN
ncbi:hypothetical protein HMPREF1248_0335 [Coriobacteriaceae bacterium BV3Ac1]|nr:hypothetical protein HMPREF1248_0335 [Coriobacteriaceae bacterium BV3Ac1]